MSSVEKVSFVDPGLLQSVLDELYALDNPPSSIESQHAVLDRLFVLLDKLLAAVGQAMGDASEALNDVNNARYERMFDEVKKQMQAADANFFLKVLKPLLSALGVFLIFTLPINMVMMVVLASLMSVLLAVDIQSAITGDNFLMDFFTLLAGGDEKVATALNYTFMALVYSVVGFALLSSMSSRLAEFLQKGIDLLRRAVSEPSNLFASLSLRGIPESFKKFLENFSLRFTPEFLKELEMYANLTMIGGSTVQGAVTIKSEVLKVQLAEITKDVAILDAIESLLQRFLDGLISEIDALGELSNLLIQQFDQVLAQS